MKTGAELEDRRDRSRDVDHAGGLVERTRQDLQQRALAGAILADDAHDLAAVDVERNIVQGPELAVPRPPREHLPQQIRRVPIQLVHLRQVLHADGRRR